MSRQLTQIYLDTSQKVALQKRAKARGTKIAEEVRNAVDAYLRGVGPEELEMLDKATAQAARNLERMADRLDVTNKKFDDMFRRLEQLERQERTAA